MVKTYIFKSSISLIFNKRTLVVGSQTTLCKNKQPDKMASLVQSWCLSGPLGGARAHLAIGRDGTSHNWIAATERLVRSSPATRSLPRFRLPRFYAPRATSGFRCFISTRSKVIITLCRRRENIFLLPKSEKYLQSRFSFFYENGQLMSSAQRRTMVVYQYTCRFTI